MTALQRVSSIQIGHESDITHRGFPQEKKRIASEKLADTIHALRIVRMQSAEKKKKVDRPHGKKGHGERSRSQ